MKRKNNKGFTLIELLAVIVILGIILTIVVSNVVKYITKARVGSYEDAFKIIMKDLKTEMMANQMNGTTTGLLKECTDEGSTKCYTEYVGLYDKNNIKMQIAGNDTNGYTIVISPIGSFAGVKDNLSTSIDIAKIGSDKSSLGAHLKPDGSVDNGSLNPDNVTITTTTPPENSD